MSVAAQNLTGILYLNKVRVSSSTPVFRELFHILGSKVRDGTLHTLLKVIISAHFRVLDTAMHSVNRLVGILDCAMRHDVVLLYFRVWSAWQAYRNLPLNPDPLRLISSIFR